MLTNLVGDRVDELALIVRTGVFDCRRYAPVHIRRVFPGATLSSIETHLDVRKAEQIVLRERGSGNGTSLAG